MGVQALMSDRSTAQRIYALYERRVNNGKPREYLGWSMCGAPCDRQVWLAFRWARRPRFEGRIGRLFERGHREEAWVLEDLKAIGARVWSRDEDGNQFAVSSHGGHSRGHADAVVDGLPEAPRTPHLLDVKSISRKKMDELKDKGFRETFPKYWAQGQGYMGHLELTRAMFLFVCKDDDEILPIRFDFDKAEFDRLESRNLRLIKASEPPTCISDNPEHPECVFCDFRLICHGNEVPDVNCRSCAHSTPDTDAGGWVCMRERSEIRKSPLAGCEDHRYIPALLERFAEPIDGHEASNRITYRNKLTDATFVNGGGQLHLSSAEIRAVGDKRMLGQERTDDVLKQMRKEFGAEYCG